MKIEKKGKRWLAFHDDRLTKLNAEGMGTQEIADTLGFAFGTVRNRLYALGLKEAQPKPRDYTQSWKSGKMEREPSAPVEKLDPLAYAASYLPGFCRVTMTILENGRRQPIRLWDVFRRLNPILKAQGQPQVGPEDLRV